MDTSKMDHEECHNLQLELDQVKQQLHQANLHLKVLEATHQDLQQDILLEEANAAQRKQELKTKLKETKQVLANLKTTQTEEITQLEFQLSAKNKECERLQNEIQFYEKKISIEEVTFNDTVKPEIILLENETFEQKCQELHSRLENIQQQRHSICLSIQETEEDLAEHQTALEVTNEELVEKNHVIEELKQDLKNANQELETLKNQPLPTNSRGNSMFSEIEDRRVQLEEIGSKMSSKYAYLQKEYQQKKEQLLKLYTEKKELIVKIEKIYINSELNNDNQEPLRYEIEAMKDSVLASRTMVNKLPKLITKVPKQDQTKGEYLYYQEVIDSKNKEVIKHEENLIQQSTNVCDLAKTVSEAQKQQKILELNKMKLQQKIDQVKDCEI